MNEISNASPEPERLSVGEEFILWAEQYWGIKEQLGKTAEDGEAAPYDHVRKVFVKKIDEIISKRL